VEFAPADWAAVCSAAAPDSPEVEVVPAQVVLVRAELGWPVAERAVPARVDLAVAEVVAPLPVVLPVGPRQAPRQGDSRACVPVALRSAVVRALRHQLRLCRSDRRGLHKYLATPERARARPEA
jgi:hypothetical protein